MRLWVVAIVFAALVACSKYEEQCHAVVLAMTSAHNAFTDMESAAQSGNRARFEKAHKELDAALAELAATEVTGDGLRENMLRSTKQTYSQAIEPAVDALGRLLATVEKDPDIGKKYHGGRPPVTAGDGVTEEMSQAVIEVLATGGATATLACK